MQDRPSHLDLPAPGRAARLFEALGALASLGVILLCLAGPAILLAGTVLSDGAFTLEHWRNVLSDAARWRVLLGNTAAVLFWAAALCLPAGTLLAALLIKTDARGRRLAAALLVVAATFPVYIQQAAVLAILDAQSLRGSAAAVGAVHALAHLPLITLAIALALLSVRRELEEAAILEGGGSWRVFFHVSLRGAAGGIAAAGVLLALLVTTDHSVSDVLGVRTFAEESATQFALNARPQEPAIVSLPQLLLFGLLLGVLLGRLFGESWSPHLEKRPLRFPLGRWRGAATAALAAAAAALAAGPAVLLAARAGDLRELPGYVAVFSGELSTSLWTSGVAALLCCTLAVGAAWRIVRRKLFWRLTAAALVLLLAVPAPISGIGLIVLLNRPGLPGSLYDSPAILVLGYVTRFLPVAVILLIPAVRSVPVRLEETAAVDGCSRAGVLRRLVLPLCLPAMALVALVVTVLSLGELPCSLLIAPPGYSTVATRFFSMIHYGLYGDAAALCILSVGTVLLPCAGLLFLLRRGRILPCRPDVQRRDS